MKLTWREMDLRLRRTFKIAHGATDVRRNVVVEVEARLVVPHWTRTSISSPSPMSRATERLMMFVESRVVVTAAFESKIRLLSIIIAWGSFPDPGYVIWVSLDRIASTVRTGMPRKVVTGLPSHCIICSSTLVLFSAWMSR